MTEETLIAVSESNPVGILAAFFVSYYALVISFLGIQRIVVLIENSRKTQEQATTYYGDEYIVGDHISSGTRIPLLNSYSSKSYILLLDHYGILKVQ